MQLTTGPAGRVVISFDGYSYDYPEAQAPSLGTTTLEVARGQLALVAGPSGVGKSTLLRAVNGLVPGFTGGVVSGRATVAGLDPVALGPAVLSRHVGFVSGDPEAGFVTELVVDEVAFALEHRGVPRTEMQARVRDALAAVGLDGLEERSLTTLSGGERQRVAVAGALALRPEILVLDEPTSQLDDDAAESLLSSVVELARRKHLTVLLSEHRIARVANHVDRVIHIRHPGSTPICGPPSEILPTIERHDIGPPAPSSPGRVVLGLSGLSYAYEGRTVLDGIDLEVRSRELVALTGPSGAGKTTLLRLCVGLLRPDGGRVAVAGEPIEGREVAEICRHAGYLPQDPGALLYADTVRDELLITLANHGLSPLGPHSPDGMLERLRILHLARRYPRDLSTGERQRVALGAIAVTRPELLLLDEPTRGLDNASIAGLARLLHSMTEEGTGVLVATHDSRLVRAAHRVVRLRSGRLVPGESPARP